MKKIILIFTLLVTTLSFGQNITELKQKAEQGNTQDIKIIKLLIQIK